MHPEPSARARHSRGLRARKGAARSQARAAQRSRTAPFSTARTRVEETNAARAREGFRVNVKARDAKLFGPIGDPTAAAGGSWCLVGVGASSGGQFSTWARVWSLGVDVRLTRAQNSTLERRRARRRDHDPRSPRRAYKIVAAYGTRARVDAHEPQRAACRAGRRHEVFLISRFK